MCFQEGLEELNACPSRLAYLSSDCATKQTPCTVSEQKILSACTQEMWSKSECNQKNECSSHAILLTEVVTLYVVYDFLPFSSWVIGSVTVTVMYSGV